MKTILLLACFAANMAHANAQWEADMRLTRDASGSVLPGNRGRWIVSHADTVCVFWEDSRDGLSEIYYKRSFDAGRTWGTDTRFTDPPAYSKWPALALTESTMHVAWTTKHTDSAKTFYRRSTNAGTDWGDRVQLSYDGSNCVPNLAAAGTDVHVIWRRDQAAQSVILYARSTDDGLSWGNVSQISEGTVEAYNPCLQVSGHMVHILWEDTRSGKPELYYRRSTDRGETWKEEIRVTNSPGVSNLPALAVAGETVHLLWDDNRHGGVNQLYYLNSTNSGVSWGAEMRLTTFPGKVSWPCVVAEGNTVHVAWQDDRSGNNELYSQTSKDGGLKWRIDTLLVNNRGTSSEHPALSISSGVLHLIWSDKRDGPNGEIYYSRNAAGGSTGIPERTEGTPDEFLVSHNYPNPFTSTTHVQYLLGDRAHVTVEVRDIFGNIAIPRLHQYQPAGSHVVCIDGSSLSPGVYFITLKAGAQSSTRRITHAP